MAEAERHDFPELPPESVLTLQEHLAMQRAVGQETRYRALAELLREGESSASELADRLDEPSNRLHYHLDEFQSAGVVGNHKRKERGAEGLYSYYEATALGEAVMTHGVAELIPEERNLLERYS
jgi:predicted ArsR family transcriptional regulator